VFADGGRPYEWDAIVGLLGPGGLIVKDDLTPGRTVEGDPVCEALLRGPRLAAVEILTTPGTAAIVAALAEERLRDRVPLGRNELELSGRLGQ